MRHIALYALILDHDENECRRLLKEAAESAENALNASLSRSAPPLVAREIVVGVDPETMKPRVESIAPGGAGYGGARMSVREYSNGLMTLACFGSSDALARAGAIPEEDYRSPGIVMEDSGWQSIQAYKDLASEHDEEALARLRAMESRLSGTVKLVLVALVALLERGENAFRAALVALLKDHKKRVSKTPADMSGLVCMPGMILCRVALRRGIVIEDQNYLPLRFMPGHPANPVPARATEMRSTT